MRYYCTVGENSSNNSDRSGCFDTHYREKYERPLDNSYDKPVIGVTKYQICAFFFEMFRYNIVIINEKLIEILLLYSLS